jgi:hypothetical protein
MPIARSKKSPLCLATAKSSNSQRGRFARIWKFHALDECRLLMDGGVTSAVRD